jgi:hypothetical protein
MSRVDNSFARMEYHFNCLEKMLENEGRFPSSKDEKPDSKSPGNSQILRDEEEHGSESTNSSNQNENEVI